MRRLVAFVIVAVSRVASAENEVSDGSAGSRSIASVTTVNRFGVLDAPAQAGDSTIQTRAELLVAGDLALLHVTQTSDALPIDGDTLRVEDAAVGQFALVRVKQVDGTTVTLTEPLARAWPAAFTQIVFVPQYASLTIESEGKLEAPAWDGRTGGVIAIAVAGELRNDGQIHADGRGFRGGSGGMAEQSMFPSELTRNGEGLLRGEFPLLRAFAPTSTGGAIGRFFQAFSTNGGGGGGNATKGGKPPSIQNNSGGVGGLRIGATGPRLFFGGGAAGTAQGNTFLLASGGAGGGAIVIFADSMTGSGRVSARGVSGATIDSEGRRHSSGGAGGTIVVELTGSLGCGALDASGAEGQSVTSCCVASAGGGAGRLFVSASSVACELRALSGTSGTFDGSRRDGEPSLPEPGEIDVREASRTAHPARRFTSCAAAPAPTTILLGLLVVLRRRQRS